MSSFKPLPGPPRFGEIVEEEVESSDGTVTLTAAQLEAEVGGGGNPANPDRLTRILVVASEIVLKYAPAAPAAITNEAVIRLGGYLAQSDFGTIRSQEVGAMKVEYVINHAMMFRASGAMALLTRYKTRRAGVI